MHLNNLLTINQTATCWMAVIVTLFLILL